MKKNTRKTISFFVAVLLVFSSLPVYADTAGNANAAGTVSTTETMLNSQLVLHQETRSLDGSPLSENYLVYTPGENLVPAVSYGYDVAGAASYSRALVREAEEGHTVVAGSNGDFFALATGVALGIIIRDGELCSSERLSCENLGFLSDGTAILGRSGLSITINDQVRNYSEKNLNLNKSLNSTNGLVVFTSQFGSTNGVSGNALTIRIQKDDPAAVPTPGGVLTGTVLSAAYTEGAQSLYADQIMVCLAGDTAYPGLAEAVSAIAAGDLIELAFTVDEEWKSVVNALGVERRLVTDGELVDWTTETGRAPRSAAGLKEDGTLVLYTVDGRDKSHSVGLTYTELAQRMLELGCVQAVNLDGGDSTQLYAAKPGYSENNLVNSPSGTTVRRCANYLIFRNQAERTDTAARLHIYGDNAPMLPGAQIALTVKATDEGWYPVDISGKTITWGFSASGIGVMDGENVFTAKSKEGTVKLTAVCGKATGSIEMEVVARPDEIKLYDSKGNELTEPIQIYAGESLQMKAAAYKDGLALKGGDQCYTWNAGSELGTMENGLLTASETPAEGFLTVRAGDVTKSFAVSVYKDEEAPVISAAILERLMTAVVSDAMDKTMDASRIQVTYDGDPVDFIYIGASGGLYYNLPEADNKLHHIVITAVDNRGNRSRLGLEDMAGTLQSTVFNDVSADSSSAKYIQYLFDQGIMAGKIDGEGIRRFDGASSLTRQEFATTLCNWLGADLEAYAETELPFTDKDQIAAWALPYVKAAYSLAYMAGKGSSDGSVRFDPAGTITRQEVMTVLAKMLEEGYASPDITASDAADVAAWAQPFVRLLTGNGIVVPSDGKLRPTAPITREELAAMIYAMD